MREKGEAYSRILICIRARKTYEAWKRKGVHKQKS